MRWILVECARIHVRKYDSKITEFYRKLKRKGKHENVAIIGAARKLLQTIYYMLKKGESFHSLNALLSFSTVVTTTWV